MKVYVVLYDKYIDYETEIHELEGVFRTREEAEKYIKKQPKQHQDDYSIEERDME